MLHGHHNRVGGGEGVWWFLFAIGSLVVAYFAMRIAALKNEGVKKDVPSI